ICEDFVGFGLLRTVMDLHRSKEYGDDSWNLPAAGERLFRETTSILTDNMLGGLVAAALGLAFDGRRRAFSNSFINYPTLELFQHHVNGMASAPAAASGTGGLNGSAGHVREQAEQSFLDKLLHSLKPETDPAESRRILQAV